MYVPVHPNLKEYDGSSPSSNEVIFLIELDKCFYLESRGKGIFSDICTFHGLLSELVPIMRSHGTRRRFVSLGIFKDKRALAKFLPRHI